MDFVATEVKRKEKKTGGNNWVNRDVNRVTIQILAIFFILSSFFTLVSLLQTHTHASLQEYEFSQQFENRDEYEREMYSFSVEELQKRKKSTILPAISSFIFLVVSFGLLFFKEWARVATLVLIGFSIFNQVVIFIMTRGQIEMQRGYIPPDYNPLINTMQIVQIVQVGLMIWLFVSLKRKRVRELFE
jgi:hypothetical protein